jgi:hypothetical protein
VQTLAHEFGHATGPDAPYANPGPAGYPNKQAYVDDVSTRMLDHEGYATLKNAQVRDEIISAGGPDVGIAGSPQNTSSYQSIHQQVENGRLTREQGARQIGEIFRNGESPSTNPSETYGSNLEKALGDYYDDVVGQSTPNQTP